MKPHNALILCSSRYPHGVKVAPKHYQKILMQLHFDTTLLARNNIMDYSLVSPPK